MPGARITFACLAGSRESFTKAVLCVRSLRQFGGEIAGSAFWLYLVEPDAWLTGRATEGLSRLGLRTIALQPPEPVAGFPFAAKVLAASQAERELRADRGGDSGNALVWMDADTLVLREPGRLRLTGGETIAYRPVHHKLIGSAWSESLDRFWEAVYDACGVREEALFPMTTCAERRAVRPYINAGLLALEPRAGLMERWWEVFSAHHRRPELDALYDRDSRYAVFAHQAFLSGVLVASVGRDLMRELPEWYNYPVHLHSEYAPEHRPSDLGSLTTCRYEVLPFDASWWTQITIDEALSAWLARERLEIEGLFSSAQHAGG